MEFCYRQLVSNSCVLTASCSNISGKHGVPRFICVISRLKRFPLLSLSEFCGLGHKQCYLPTVPVNCCISGNHQYGCCRTILQWEFFGCNWSVYVIDILGKYRISSFICLEQGYARNVSECVKKFCCICCGCNALLSVLRYGNAVCNVFIR
jgi:hypothetical protein